LSRNAQERGCIHWRCPCWGQGNSVFEPHTWPDTSLGLPEPGQSCAQALTSGCIVTQQYEREPYVYHVAGAGLRIDRARSGPLPSGPIAAP